MSVICSVLWGARVRALLAVAPGAATTSSRPSLGPVTGGGSVVTVVVVLGFIYTVKVIDIILVVTGGDPAYASQTLAVESYQLSFKTFLFGQGAAMGNVPILISLVFAMVYLRFNRRTTIRTEGES